MNNYENALDRLYVEIKEIANQIIWLEASIKNIDFRSENYDEE
ncbi:hypothetical protein [Serpentinicella alkaliphila]|uniref:Uncharacterized protein n=1 Tax=Serpentinicella alkaliphila TaxID=1734049 RepID=A0A4R2TZC2_9FIRM|nr:hypothetical protein [Serpentinicella alkaliphila]TCQ03079.1 hypothetical protein EDD79_101142 [Serpentinicella alkaliphila]